MILQAADEFNLDLSQSILIGDKTGDIEAGKKAGLKKNYLSNGTKVLILKVFLKQYFKGKKYKKT